MKQGRLTLLLIVMVALLALRWFAPPGGHGAGPVSAVVRPPADAGERPAEAVARMVAESRRQPDAPSATADDTTAGNAFAVRQPPAPPPPPPPPSPIVQPVVVVATPVEAAPAEPAPPPPPPPPLQIIGTWDDGGGPAVFVALPQGTVIARQGTVLLAEYRVTRVNAQALSLMHVVSQHEWHLPIPRVQARP